MKIATVFRKLLLGHNADMSQSGTNPLQGRIDNMRAIWNNDYQDDHGIEKIVRLFLSSSQLLFPGIYIKYLADRMGAAYQDLAMDFYVLLKVLLPLLILSLHWYESNLVVAVLIYVLAETVLYIPTLILASDTISSPRSYKRSILLLFLNYCEIIFSFAVFYSCGNYLNNPFTHWFDPIYVSLVTGSTIGFGDFYPVEPMGKFLVSLQALFFLFFVILFLNFFAANLKTKGYFDRKKKKKIKKGGSDENFNK